MQQNLFGDDPDPERARAARDEGIGLADTNASPQWKTAAREAIRYCARKHPGGFTADHVLARLADRGQRTRNTPALGPVMQAAAKAGEIVKTGEYWPSEIPRRHRDLTVWRATPPE